MPVQMCLHASGACLQLVADNANDTDLATTSGPLALNTAKPCPDPVKWNTMFSLEPLAVQETGLWLCQVPVCDAAL